MSCKVIPPDGYGLKAGYGYTDYKEYHVGDHVYIGNQSEVYATADEWKVRFHRVVDPEQTWVRFTDGRYYLSGKLIEKKRQILSLYPKTEYEIKQSGSYVDIYDDEVEFIASSPGFISTNVVIKKGVWVEVIKLNPVIATTTLRIFDDMWNYPVEGASIKIDGEYVGVTNPNGELEIKKWGTFTVIATKIGIPSLQGETQTLGRLENIGKYEQEYPFFMNIHLPQKIKSKLILKINGERLIGESACVYISMTDDEGNLIPKEGNEGFLEMKPRNEHWIPVTLFSYQETIVRIEFLKDFENPNATLDASGLIPGIHQDIRITISHDENKIYIVEPPIPWIVLALFKPVVNYRIVYGSGTGYIQKVGDPSNKWNTETKPFYDYGAYYFLSQQFGYQGYETKIDIELSNKEDNLRSNGVEIFGEISKRYSKTFTFKDFEEELADYKREIEEKPDGTNITKSDLVWEIPVYTNTMIDGRVEIENRTYFPPAGSVALINKDKFDEFNPPDSWYGLYCCPVCKKTVGREKKHCPWYECQADFENAEKIIPKSIHEWYEMYQCSHCKVPVQENDSKCWDCGYEFGSPLKYIPEEYAKCDNEGGISFKVKEESKLQLRYVAVERWKHEGVIITKSRDPEDNSDENISQYDYVEVLPTVHCDPQYLPIMKIPKDAWACYNIKVIVGKTNVYLKLLKGYHWDGQETIPDVKSEWSSWDNTYIIQLAVLGHVQIKLYCGNAHRTRWVWDPLVRESTIVEIDEPF